MRPRAMFSFHLIGAIILLPLAASCGSGRSTSEYTAPTSSTIELGTADNPEEMNPTGGSMRFFKDPATGANWKSFIYGLVEVANSLPEGDPRRCVALLYVLLPFDNEFGMPNALGVPNFVPVVDGKALVDSYEIDGLGYLAANKECDEAALKRKGWYPDRGLMTDGNFYPIYQLFLIPESRLRGEVVIGVGMDVALPENQSSIYYFKGQVGASIFWPEQTN